MMTVADVATRLRVSPALVYGWVDAGELPCYRLGGPGKRGAIRIAEADLDRFLATRRAEKPASLPAPAPVSAKRQKLPSLRNLTLNRPSR